MEAKNALQKEEVLLRKVVGGTWQGGAGGDKGVCAFIFSRIPGELIGWENTLN